MSDPLTPDYIRGRLAQPGDETGAPDRLDLWRWCLFLLEREAAAAAEIEAAHACIEKLMEVVADVYGCVSRGCHGYVSRGCCEDARAAIDAAMASEAVVGATGWGAAMLAVHRAERRQGRGPEGAK